MAWEINYNLGVMSDHKGRKYRIAQNSRGRQDKVFIQETNAPKGYTIPEPKEQPKLRLKLKKPIEVNAKRLHVIEVRWRGDKQVTKHVAENKTHVNHERLWNHLWISPDCGKTWQTVGPVSCDYHVQYHIDEEKNETP